MNSTGSTWPEPITEEALHGLTGEIVRAIDPHTESDRAALLVQLLVAFSNVIGRGPHWRVEAKRHALNLFSVLVGDTSKSRKGSSWSHVNCLLSPSDAVWKEHCIQTGLSSGEGLIYAVRDPTEQDSGPLDNRLLVVESEFSSPLRMIGRDGNTLSPVVRQAWDGETLQVMTRQFPMIATSAHVSIIGHVTRDELRRELTRTDAGNGFGNRFLWVCARRSKVLPDGGRVPEAELESLAGHLKQAVDYARSLGDYELRRDDGAGIIWHSIYAELSEGKPGLFGAVTSRAEAQVMRLACIYALLDQSSVVQPDHLHGALAVWRYCENFAQYIFGDALGRPLADHLLRILRSSPQGLTRTEISGLLGRNLPGAEITQALEFLALRNLATSAKSGENEGRPAQRWHATDPAAR